MENSLTFDYTDAKRSITNNLISLSRLINHLHNVNDGITDSSKNSDTNLLFNDCANIIKVTKIIEYQISTLSSLISK